jgi:hypothetical protein
MTDGPIRRAGKRTEWAAHPLQGAAEDLRAARDEGAPVDSEPDPVRAEGRRVGALVEAIHG